MNKAVLICLVLAALVLVGALAQMPLQGPSYGHGEERDGEESFSQVDFLEFLGGVRQFMSYVLWVRTDGIHHAYYGNLADEAELIPYYYMISWLDPHYVDAYYVAGLTIFKAGREQEAIDFTRRGIANNPDSGDLYASLGDLYMRTGEYELAQEAFREAEGKRFELVDEILATSSLAAASKALGDLEGTIAAKTRLLDGYRMMLVRPGLEQETREFLVRMINSLADEIRGLTDELEGGPE